MSGDASGGVDPVVSLVKGYLIERVRSLSGADPELFARAFAAYDAAEQAHHGDGHGHLAGVAEHPLVGRVLKLMGKRAAHVYRAALRIARDNRAMAERLREVLDRKNVNVTTKAGRARAEAEYERVLAATVPLEASLDNVDAVADSIELVNGLVNAKSRLKRSVVEMAWATLAPLALRDEALREEVEALKEELTGRPERLQAMADLVRREGPRIVREAYERGGGEVEGDVLTSGGHR